MKEETDKLDGALSGETVVNAYIKEGMNDLIVIETTSGKTVEIEYDWIYSVTATDTKKPPQMKR